MLLIGSFLTGWEAVGGAATGAIAVKGAASTPLTGVLDLGDALGVTLGGVAGGRVGAAGVAVVAAAAEGILSGGSPTESMERRESVDPL